jgi:hypothetical protein
MKLYRLHELEYSSAELLRDQQAFADVFNAYPSRFCQVDDEEADMDMMIRMTNLLLREPLTLLHYRQLYGLDLMLNGIHQGHSQRRVMEKTRTEFW